MRGLEPISTISLATCAQTGKTLAHYPNTTGVVAQLCSIRPGTSSKRGMISEKSQTVRFIAQQGLGDQRVELLANYLGKRSVSWPTKYPWPVGRKDSEQHWRPNNPHTFSLFFWSFYTSPLFSIITNIINIIITWPSARAHSVLVIIVAFFYRNSVWLVKNHAPI